MSSVLERARRVGAEVAAAAADAVDREARFPAESLAALREARLLGILVPAELGGEGAPLADAFEACHALGRYCASTAMVFAMHQIQLACLVRHALDSPWHRAFLARCADEQLLLASATSEAGIGGDVRRSSCAVERAGEGRFRLAKNATVISYGADADAILATARRDPDAPPSDQVLAVVLAPDYALERTGGWDALGMRGTCSNGYWLRAEGGVEQILPVPYADVSAQTMLPVSHLAWSSLWLGIAADAVSRARAFVREQARKQPGSTPAGAVRLAEAVALLQQMKGTVLSAVRRYEAALDDPDRLGSISLAVEMNGLKTSASRLAAEVVSLALQVCGIHGYRNDSRFSLGRHLRDAHSAALMVSNDRILGHTAGLLLVDKEDPRLLA